MSVRASSSVSSSVKTMPTTPLNFLRSASSVTGLVGAPSGIGTCSRQLRPSLSVTSTIGSSSSFWLLSTVKRTRAIMAATRGSSRRARANEGRPAEPKTRSAATL